MPQTGAEHHLFLGYQSGSPKDRLTINTLIDTQGAPKNVGVATPVTVNDIAGQLQLYDCLRDVTVGGSPNTVDSTCREDAREGFSTQIVTTSEGSMSVQIRYEPADENGVMQDLGFQALMMAFLTKKDIFAVDLDKDITELGARGLAGNWRVGFSQPKPVQGLVVVDFSFSLSGKPQYIYTTASRVFASLV